ncbi:hypothetical protein FBY34_8297 [Streptomyces sp. SLBN-115]|nr:hypothetical protein FBY34_8297 [Streptomyces sp. SLBN-115]
MTRWRPPLPPPWGATQPRTWLPKTVSGPGQNGLPVPPGGRQARLETAGGVQVARTAALLLAFAASDNARASRSSRRRAAPFRYRGTALRLRSLASSLRYA